MKLTTGISSGKAAFYDRNPLDVQKNASNTVAPHTQVQRWIYTVPAARKAQVTHLESFAHRVTVATTASQATMYNKITPSGGSTLVTAECTFYGNNIDSGNDHTIGTNVLLLAADAIESDDLDASTAGTVQLSSNLQATEFDA